MTGNIDNAVLEKDNNAYHLVIPHVRFISRSMVTQTHGVQCLDISTKEGHDATADLLQCTIAFQTISGIALNQQWTWSCIDHEKQKQDNTLERRHRSERAVHRLWKSNITHKNAVRW